jgi:hypothetical protein
MPFNFDTIRKNTVFTSRPPTNYYYVTSHFGTPPGADVSLLHVFSVKLVLIGFNIGHAHGLPAGL